mgnify:CR=1 FL=1
MDLSDENVAGLAARMPEFGRLRIHAGVLVLERTFRVSAAAELEGVLAGREADEDLLIQRYPANWLVTFGKTFGSLDEPGKSW